MDYQGVIEAPSGSNLNVWQKGCCDKPPPTATVESENKEKVAYLSALRSFIRVSRVFISILYFALADLVFSFLKGTNILFQ